MFRIGVEDCRDLSELELECALLSVVVGVPTSALAR